MLDKNILLVGMSFKSSSISHREKFYKIILELRKKQNLLNKLDCEEYAFLTTCNRVELYLVTRDPILTLNKLYRLLEENSLQDSENHLYILWNEEAVEHLFLVSAGLDSLIIGEPQIHEQVKKVWKLETSLGNSKGILSALFPASLNAANRIRKKYNINSLDVSLGNLALDLALSKLKQSEINCIIFGFGTMGRILADKISNVCYRLYIATKKELGEISYKNAILINYSEARKMIKECNLIISSTVSEDFVLGYEDLNDGIKRVIVDLGMPRNIDPNVRYLPNTEYYDLDDITKLSKINYKEISFDLNSAEKEIKEEAEKFYEWLVITKLSKVVSRLNKYFENLRSKEIEKYKAKLQRKGEEYIVLVDLITKRLTYKILYDILSYLKSNKEVNLEEKLKTIERIFNNIKRY
ncbi:MAG: glutamyl-tRNA reductase [Thermoproteota archaeon]